MKEETVGSRIRVLRKFRGMTQEALAEKMYTKACTISNYENDQIELTSQKIKLLAEILGVKAGYFFGDEPLEYYVKKIERKDCSATEKDANEIATIIKKIRNDKFRKVLVMTVRNLSEVEIN